MKTQFVVVANASLARFFKRDSPTDPLIAMPTLEHPESRLKGIELADDRPGHEATDNSSGGNRFEPRSDSRRKEHTRFARQIAQHLDVALAHGEFDGLVICASSPFLGELKAALSPALERRLQFTVDSDFTSLGLDELELRLRHHEETRAAGTRIA
jgi:protein required for attachment to host cells